MDWIRKKAEKAAKEADKVAKKADELAAKVADEATAMDDEYQISAGLEAAVADVGRTEAVARMIQLKTDLRATARNFNEWKAGDSVCRCVLCAHSAC